MSTADVIKLRHIKYAFKMKSQKFFCFQALSLSKIVVVTLAMMLACRVNSDVMHSYRL